MGDKVASVPLLLSPDAIINENYKYLKGFLEDLAPPERSTLIQDWELAGLVYLDYIHVNEMLDRIQQVGPAAFPVTWELTRHLQRLLLTAEGELVLLCGRHFKLNMGHL